MTKQKQSTPTAVSAAFIRTAFKEGKFTAPDEALPSLVGTTDKGPRGRLNPKAVEAFEAQVKGFVYAGEKRATADTAKTVTLPLTKMNAKGARLKRPEDFPLAVVRAKAGVPDKRGKVSAKEIEAATAAIVSERGWDKPSAAKASKPKA